ncbi:MAG: hypothetical protein K2Y37_16120 [Pirellulales bacterium]|nr:hypothetical protein [Pirellulales bacterium]
MLRRVLRLAARLVLVAGFVAPPFLAYTWAVCPNTMKHNQLCPDKLAVACPASGGTQGCDSFEWVTVYSGDFGCISTKQNKQCVDGPSNKECYSQGRCKEKADASGCEQDLATGQTFMKIEKLTLDCV